MKKLWICLLTAVTGFTACEGPAGPPGRDGTSGVETLWDYINFEVSFNDWQLAGVPNDIDSYFYCTFDNLPEITEDIHDYGLTVCYYTYIDDTGVEVQTTIPHTQYYMETRIDEFGNEFESPFAMYFSHSTTPGSIEFRITFSDFYTGEKLPPEFCRFKLVLVY